MDEANTQPGEGARDAGTEQPVDQEPSMSEPFGAKTEPAATTEPTAWGATEADAEAGRAGREWLAQLQSMIEGLASQAAPVVREIGAKAAELAAAAGDKAGPIAHRAAEATEHAGARLAERGREVAAELRRDNHPTNGQAGGTGTTEEPHETTIG
jgi:hypothetical protein